MISLALAAMTLTPNQVARIKAVPPKAKAALTAKYNKENKENPPAKKKLQQKQQQVGRPKAPAKRAPMANQIASLVKRGGSAHGVPNYMDPMCPLPVPAVMSNGRALPHTGLVSDDFVVHANRKILLVTNAGESGTVALLIEVTNEGRAMGSPVMYTIPTMAQGDADGGPSAARAMKLGVTVINCSNALKRGGRVTYLNSSQRLPALGFDMPFAGVSYWHLGNYQALVDGVKSSPYRRRITADDLIEPKQLIAYPVDTISYNEFKSFKGSLPNEHITMPAATVDGVNYGEHTRTHTGFLDYVCVHSPGNPEVAPRPMSTIAYIFEPTSEPQDYSLTIRASYFTRWPLTSVPGQSMRPTPTAPVAHLNHAHNKAEATANDLVHVGMGALAAHLAPKAGGALRSAAGRLGSVASAAARMGYQTAAGGIEMAEGAGAGELAIVAPLL